MKSNGWAITCTVGRPSALANPLFTCYTFNIWYGDIYSKRHNKFLLPALVKAIYGSFYKAESEISNVVNYRYDIFVLSL